MRLLMLIISTAMDVVGIIIFSFTLFTKLFSLGIDDDHHVALKSISDGVDCEHDYINATYIDVRALENALQIFHW